MTTDFVFAVGKRNKKEWKRGKGLYHVKQHFLFVVVVSMVRGKTAYYKMFNFFPTSPPLPHFSKLEQIDKLSNIFCYEKKE